MAGERGVLEIEFSGIGAEETFELGTELFEKGVIRAADGGGAFVMAPPGARPESIEAGGVAILKDEAEYVPAEFWFDAGGFEQIAKLVERGLGGFEDARGVRCRGV